MPFIYYTSSLVKLLETQISPGGQLRYLSIHPSIMYGVTYRTQPNMALENFSCASVSTSILILHTVLLAEDDGKAMHGPVSLPPPPRSLHPSSLRLVQSSLPCLFYSSWPLHNRTQIQIALRRKRRAFLSLAHPQSRSRPTHPSCPSLPPSVPPSRSPACPPPLLAGLSVCALNTGFVCASCAYVNGGCSRTLTHRAFIVTTISFFKHGENLENLAQRPVAAAG